MKKIQLFSKLVFILLGFGLLYSCNVGEDSPPEYQLFAIYNDYPPSFELSDGTKYETTSISTLNDGDLILIHFSIDENNTFKLLNRSNAIATPGVKYNRLDTLGKANFISVNKLTPFKKYLAVEFRVNYNSNEKKAFHLSYDSVALTGNAQPPFVKNDTMFLQMHYNDYDKPGYTDGTDVVFYNLSGLPYATDSVTVAVRYKTQSGDKSVYTTYKTRN